MKIGKTVLGLSKKDSEMLYFYGKGSSGKSTLFQFISESFNGIYEAISSNAFDNSREFAKCINGIKPCTRILHMDEPSMAKKMSNALKSLANGKIVHTKLYQEGNYETEFYGKMYFTANNLPKFDTINTNEGDTGLLRRVKFLSFDSKFVKPEDLPRDENGIPTPDIVNHIYPRDKRLSEACLPSELIMQFTTVCLLFAQFNFPCPPTFKTLDQVLDLKKFRDKTLQRVKGARVAKAHMIKLLETFMPFSNITNMKGWKDAFEKIGIGYRDDYAPLTGEFKTTKGCFMDVCINPEMMYVLQLPEGTTLNLHDKTYSPDNVSSGFSVVSEMSQG